MFSFLSTLLKGDSNTGVFLWILQIFFYSFHMFHHGTITQATTNKYNKYET